MNKRPLWFGLIAALTLTALAAALFSWARITAESTRLAPAPPPTPSLVPSTAPTPQQNPLPPATIARPSRTPAPTVVAGATVVANLQQLFQLGQGQVAFIDDGQMQIAFDAVTEDSRCPASVLCYWAGQIKLQLTITGGNGLAETITLVLAGNNRATKDSLRVVAGHEIALQAVEPYPADPEDKLAGLYTATLVVRPAP